MTIFECEDIGNKNTKHSCLGVFRGVLKIIGE